MLRKIKNTKVKSKFNPELKMPSKSNKLRILKRAMKFTKSLKNQRSLLKLNPLTKKRNNKKNLCNLRAKAKLRKKFHPKRHGNTRNSQEMKQFRINSIPMRYLQLI